MLQKLLSHVKIGKVRFAPKKIIIKPLKSRQICKIIVGQSSRF